MEAGSPSNMLTIVKHTMHRGSRFENPLNLEIPGFEIRQFPQEKATLKLCIPKGCESCQEKHLNPTREVDLCTCDQRLCIFTLRFHNHLHVMSHNYKYNVLCRLIRRGKKETSLFSHSFYRKDSLVARESFMCNLKNVFKFQANEIHFEIFRERKDNLVTNTESLTDFYGQLYYSDKFSKNVSVNVSGRVFNVNQQIISLKSPVFNAMFSHGMREDQDKVINIEGFDADTVDDMFYYIYTTDTKNIHKNPFELFKIADRYGILDLMDSCVEWMKFNVDSENSMSILRLAILYELHDLEKGVCQFIRDNVKQFVHRNDYKDYLLENLDSSTVLKTLQLCEEYPLALKEVKAKILEHARKDITEFIKMDEFLDLFGKHHLLIRNVLSFSENHKKRKLSEISQDA